MARTQGVDVWHGRVDCLRGRVGQRRESRDFVFACIVVDPATAARLRVMLRGFKYGMSPKDDPDTWELHGVDIMRGFRPGEKWGQRIRESSRKLAVFSAIINILCEFDVVCFGITVPNKRAAKKYNKYKILEFAMTVLLEHLERFARNKTPDSTHSLGSCKGGWAENHTRCTCKPQKASQCAIKRTCNSCDWGRICQLALQ